MRRASTFAWGCAAGLGLVAALDAASTTLLPIFGFLPVLYYLIGAGVVGLAAAAVPHRLWRPLGACAVLVGGLGVAWMTTCTPRWQTHTGWQNCRLIAGPWYLRSVAPVAVPDCGVLSMCANEAAHDVGKLLQAGGCPAP